MPWTRRARPAGLVLALTCAACGSGEVAGNGAGSQTGGAWGAGGVAAAIGAMSGAGEQGGASGGAVSGAGAQGDANGGVGGRGTSRGGATDGGPSAAGGALTTGGSAGTSTGGASAGGSATDGGTTDFDAGSAAGALLFNGDFETGDLSQWTGEVSQCQPGRITVYSAATAPVGAPAPRQGTYAARFDVLDSDVAPCTPTANPRAQVSSPKTLLAPGQEYWEAWSLYVPSALPPITCGASCTNPYFVFQEDYGPPYNGSPAIGWGFERAGSADVLSIRRGAQYGYDRVWEAPLVRDAWIDFVVHKQMANTTAGGGFIEAWVDGTAITFSSCGCARLLTQTMHADATSTYAFYLNHYREHGMFAEGSVYFDGGRVGTTRRSVE